MAQLAARIQQSFCYPCGESRWFFAAQTVDGAWRFYCGECLVPIGVPAEYSAPADGRREEVRAEHGA